MAFPPKKPSVVIGIKAGPSPLKSPGSSYADDPAPDAAPDHSEPDADDAGGSCEPNPEAVDYRTEAETCQHCEYMQGDSCSHPIVAQQVSPGDSCAAFKGKAEHMGMGEQQYTDDSADYGQQ